MRPPLKLPCSAVLQMLEIFLFLLFGQHPAYMLEVQTQILINQLSIP